MKRELVIDSYAINDENDCYVIAEVGTNHQGDLQKAKDLMRAAHEAGANAVKFQKKDNRASFTRQMYDSPYNSEHSFGPTYGTHRDALEFGREQYVELKRYAAELGITFFATAFDIPSADFCEELELPAYKIASGDLKNIPLLRHVAKFGKPMIISTGAADMKDVERAYETIMPLNSQLCILQCTALYPSDPQDMNLRVIATLRERYPDIVIGLSDHQSGIAMALVGYVLGARVIEKHFTLNRAWRGSDNAFSLEPVGLQKLVRDLHRARVAMGDGIKRQLPAETKHMYKTGKKLVAARDLPAEHVVTVDDIAVKSPNDGLAPYHFDDLIGKTTRRPLGQDETFSFDDFDGFN